MLLAGDIEMGHARALLALDRAEQILMAHLVVQRRLSVRETERLVSQKVEEAKGQAKVAQKRAADTINDRDVARLRERIADHLNTTVEIISKANGRGKLVIHFSSNDAFSGLLERLKLSAAVQD
jgi:exonuclease involved in chromosome partitioning, PARB protein